jgi:hypothetical protein
MMVSKLLIWLVVSSGLLVAIWLAFSSYYVTSIVLPGRYQRPELRLSPFADITPTEPHFHDSNYWLGLGSLKFRIFPRRWAAYLIALGVLLVVVGLIAILHVPNSHSMLDQ